jgi:hypothetical protein
LGRLSFVDASQQGALIWGRLLDTAGKGELFSDGKGYPLRGGTSGRSRSQCAGLASVMTKKLIEAAQKRAGKPIASKPSTCTERRRMDPSTKSVKVSQSRVFRVLGYEGDGLRHSIVHEHSLGRIV